MSDPQTPLAQGVNAGRAGADRRAPGCQHVYGPASPYRGRRCGFPASDRARRLCVLHDTRQKPDRLRHRLPQLLDLHLRELCAARADLSDLRLGSVDIEGSSLLGVNLDRTNLEFAKMARVKLRPHRWGRELTHSTARGARLNGADLSAADITEADLSNAQMQDVDLSNTRGDRATFRGCMLCRSRMAGEAQFMGADFSEARLGGTTIERTVNLEGAIWWDAHQQTWIQRVLHLRPPCLRDEREGRLLEAERTYRQLKRSYEHHGLYEEAGLFHVREMECRRAQLAREGGAPATTKWLFMSLLHFVSDYLENPVRVLCLSAAIIMAIAVVQGGLGITDASEEKRPVAGPGYTLLPTADSARALMSAIYLSVITFTTTGFGDYLPHSGLGRLLAACEALVGAFMMALFLVCLARKFGRS